MASYSAANVVNHSFRAVFCSSFRSDVDRPTTIRVAWACINRKRIPHSDNGNDVDDNDDADGKFDDVNNDGRGTNSAVDEASTSF
mmetsp:Transcript_13449/g.28183  ORF Transcript_13449/g.28183 Transcript_13449/m.28183 type:complete len:85 (-) Transcript_13449:230-484(-)